MAPGPKDEDEPLFGRESLFRQKLEQLRTNAHMTQLPRGDSNVRSREIEQVAYLANVEHTLAKSDPKELERLTLLDSLTQLFNQRTIVRILKDEVKRSQRYKQPVSVLACTIDGLKDVASNYGALASDSLLQGLANFIMNTIRDVDVPARFDLEKFLVVCPQTDTSGVAVLAERIRSRVAVERISDIGRDWHVTVSIGLASFPTNAQTGDELLERAFKALAVSVENGGNKVSLA